MSSGNRQIVINSQERAVSNDINRAQDFITRDYAELFMRMLMTRSGGEFDAGFALIPDSSTLPMTAEIIGGGLVRPTSGTFSFSVDAMVLYAIQSDGGPDNSDCKYVRDPGLITGSLNFATNVSGFSRIDIVECRINPTPEIVSDNRDIYNPVTGLFNAVNVTKEQAARLEYRVRQGTPNAGFPGTVSGWLPLMVALIPNNAASNNDCSFWDVRPMLEDRESAARNLTNATPPTSSIEIAMCDRSSSSSVAIQGMWQAVNKGRRLGGQFRSSAAGPYDGPGINVADTPNQSTAIAEPLTAHVFLYACTPFGLPRWARYNYGGARVPQSPKGLLIVSTVKPDNVGRPQSTIALPPSWGLGGTCAVDDAVLVTMLPARVGNTWGSFNTSKDEAFATRGDLGEVTGAVDGGSGFEITVPEALWPKGVRYLWVELQAQLTLPVSSAYEFTEIVNTEAAPSASPTPTALRTNRILTNANANTEVVNYTTFVKIQRPNYYPNTDATDIIVNWTVSPQALYGTGFSLPATCRLRIYGFEQ